MEKRRLLNPEAGPSGTANKGKARVPSQDEMRVVRLAVDDELREAVEALFMLQLREVNYSTKSEQRMDSMNPR